MYLRERFEELVDPIDTDALVAELRDGNRTVARLSPLRPDRRKAWLTVAAAAAVTALVVGGTFLLVEPSEVAAPEPLPTVSDPSAADIYGAVAQSMISDAQQESEECDSRARQDEEVVADTAPIEECGLYLTDRVVYVVDHPVQDQDTTLDGWCGPSEFDENPDVCDRGLSIVHTAAFGLDVRDSIELALTAVKQVEFADSRESVSEPTQGIIPYGVVNDGGLIQFGPIFSDSTAFYLGVRCDGCSGWNFRFLRLEETSSGWLIDIEFGYQV